MFRPLCGYANSRTSLHYAVLLFLVVTVAFSLLYSLILPAIEGEPSLSHNLKGAVRGEAMTFVDCLYFSATTQTTVGYGDIVPVTVLGKICAMIQAAYGYFYMAFILSLLMARAVLKPERYQDPYRDRQGTNRRILRLH